MIEYQKLFIDTYPQDLSVVVIIENKSKFQLMCRDGDEETQYSKDQYSIIYWSGREILYINASDEYYLEDEYQVKQGFICNYPLVAKIIS